MIAPVMSPTQPTPRELPVLLALARSSLDLAMLRTIDALETTPSVLARAGAIPGLGAPVRDALLGTRQLLQQARARLRVAEHASGHIWCRP